MNDYNKCAGPAFADFGNRQGKRGISPYEKDSDSVRSSVHDYWDRDGSCRGRDLGQRHGRHGLLLQGLVSDNPRSGDPGWIRLRFESGFYIGTWASNLKYGDDASTEIDLYAGFGGEFGDGYSYDLSVIRFEYPSEGGLDYVELAASIGIGAFTLGVNVSPEYLGEGGPSFAYPYVGYSWAPSDAASLDFQVGMSMADDVGGPDEDSYMDYSVTLTIPTGGVDLGLAVVGTNLDEEVCGADCELRLIFSISKSM